MKLHHIAIYVNDLEGAKDFFSKFFNAVPNKLYHNPKTGLRTYFLTFPDGGKVEIMNRPEIQLDSFNPFLRGYIHIAISVGSKELVDSISLKLSDNGYEIISGPRTTGDGYYESCIRAFEDNIIEITE
ncbi:MAG: VOC family protein [Muribaculaceae bacterium]|nr:VOC family protein [Muribaculaceae bacterium]